MINIYQYSHGLMIRDFDTPQEVNVIYRIAKRYYSTKRTVIHKKVSYSIDTIYSISNVDVTKDLKKLFFCILISRKDELISELDSEGIEYNIITLHYDIPNYNTGMETVGKTPYDYQQYYIDYILEPGTHKLIPIQTGKGKGTIMIVAVSEMKQRVFIQAKKAYIGKLKREIVNDTNLSNSDVLLIDSGKKLYNVIDMAIAGSELPAVVMCGIHTLYGFIQDWRSGMWGTDINHPYNPINLFKNLGIGVRVIDEVHQLFDMIYKIDLMTNVPKTIYMSATFSADDKSNALKARMQRFLIPPATRPKDMKPDAYTTLIKAPYRLPGIERAINRAERSAYGYTHIKYEDGLLANKGLIQRYFDYLDELFEQFYTNNIPTSGKEERKRCLFLFSRKNTCQSILSYMKKKYPKLDIRKYTDEDPDENLIQATVLISTWQSAGTAQDMPGLVVVINTVPIKAKETAIQIAGRLRNPARIGLTMTPYYVLPYNVDSQWQVGTTYQTENTIKDFMTKIIDLDMKTIK